MLRGIALVCVRRHGRALCVRVLHHRHRDAAYRRREVWECFRLCLSSLSRAISLPRGARYEPSLSLFLSFFSRSPFGITRETAAIDATVTRSRR